MQPHIKAELANCDFDLLKMQKFLSFGEEEYAQKKRIYELIFSHPEMKKSPQYYSSSRAEKIKENIRMQYLFFRDIAPNLGFKVNLQNINYAMTCIHGQAPNGVHLLMFYVCVKSMASEEQIKEWLPKIKNLDILGCYAQTELAHGSDVRGLQTTATFDKKTDEFVIHTPNIGAAKFWPGELARMATHGVVIARMIIDGTDYGPMTFLVQFRSLADHSFLPGIETGDIGSKHGYNAKDNGYAIFNHFRVPRSALLSRYIQVDRQGNINLSGNPKVAYFTMMYIRVGMAIEAHYFLAQALTVALRYSAYRTQFKTTADGTERKILDYQLQQYRLTPLLAQAYAFYFIALRAKTQFQETDKAIQKGDTSGLGTLHLLLSGLKSIMTWDTLNGMEECRQACGGHGFLDSAGISPMLLEYSARCTYEGDNNVMILQSAKGLLKQFQKVKNGESPDRNSQYLCNFAKLLKKMCYATQTSDFTADLIYEALQIKALYSVASTLEKQITLKKKGMTVLAIQNDHIASDLVRMARHHIELNIYESMQAGIGECVAKGNIDQNAVPHLKRMLRIYGIKVLNADLGPLYSTQYFNKNHAELLESAYAQEISALRPMLLPLVEGFDFTDDVLCSSIGSKKLDPYETVLKWAKEYNELNKLKVLPGFNEYIRPLMKAKL